MYDVSMVGPNTAVFQFLNGSSLTANTTHLHQRHDMEAWLATRRCLLVTASEFAAVLGKSPFTKRADLLATKLGTRPAFRGNAATAYVLALSLSLSFSLSLSLSLSLSFSFIHLLACLF